jgi:hypothetical protein
MPPDYSTFFMDPCEHFDPKVLKCILLQVQLKIEGLATQNGATLNWHLRVNFCKTIRQKNS